MSSIGVSRFIRPSRRSWLPPSVLWVIEAAIIMNVIVLLHIPVLSAVVVLPIALITPGYSIVAAILGQDTHQGRVLTLALSTMVSLAFYPLLALVLYTLKITLSTSSVLAGTDCGIALSLCIFILRERRTLARPTQPGGRDLSVSRSPTLWRGWQGGLLFGAIVVVVLAALALENPFLPRAIVSPYTQFYLTGAWANNHTIVKPNTQGPLAISVGITNRTQGTRTYRIVPVVDTSQTWQTRTVTLAENATWSGSVQGTAPATGCVHRLDISLYVNGSKSAESSLVIWLQGSRQSTAACTNGSKNGRSS